MPGTKDAFHEGDLESLLNPTSKYLVDEGLVPLVAWACRTDNITQHMTFNDDNNFMPMLNTHRIFMKWIGDYCGEAMKFSPDSRPNVQAYKK